MTNKSNLKELVYGCKHPLDAIKKIPSMIKYRKLFLATRQVEGLLSWDAGIMLHSLIMENKHPSPIIVEIGCYQGKSTIFLAHAAKRIGKKVYAFEWFRGLEGVDPRVDNKYSQYNLAPDKRKFENNIHNSGLGANVILTVGDARKTLIPEIKDHGFSTAFLDVDLYGVTSELLNQLMSVAIGGEVIIIHDYDFPGIKKVVGEFSVSYKTRIRQTLIKDNNSLNSVIFRMK